MTKHLKNTGLAVIITLFLCLLVSCNQQGEQTNNDLHKPGANIILSEAQMQLANIKVEAINEGLIGHNQLFTGVLKVDEQSIVNISSRVTGRIQKLYFKNTGENVKKGDSLYQIYSDELIAAEREYITLQRNNWNFSGRYEPSIALENKLLLLGMLPEQIEQLRKNSKISFTVTICSPAAGTIKLVNVTEGQYVDNGQTLFELADDQKLWVEAEVYQEDLSFIKVGQPSQITVPGSENLTIKSNISFIYPSFEQGKNVTLIRSVIDNTNKNLHPGMLALMSVQSHKNRGIVVPASAVIVGKNGSRIWIRNDDGSFSYKTITTGTQSEDSVLIMSDLGETKSIVTSGAYLLNSELILKNGTQNMGDKEL